MTGAEHYAKAEEILAEAERSVEDGSASLTGIQLNLQRAQLHATMALAAARYEPNTYELKPSVMVTKHGVVPS